MTRRALAVVALTALAACGDDDGVGASTDAATDALTDTTSTDVTTIEAHDDAILEVAPDVVAPLLPALDDALVFTPGDGLGDVRVQPAVAWGPPRGGVGRLVVAWTGASGEDLGIFVGAWDVDGVAAREVTAPGLVHVSREGIRNEPAVCHLAGGGFVVVWSADAPSEDAANLHIAWRRLDADGVAIGTSESEYTTDRPGNHWLAEVACRPTSAGGGFVLTGVRPGPREDMGFEVFVQPFDAEGAIDGLPFEVLARDVGGQAFPLVGVDGQGNLRVVWEDTPDVNGRTTIAAREFVTSSGNYAPGSLVELVAGANDDAVAPVLAVHPVSGHALAGGVLGNRLRLSLDVGAGFAAIALPESASAVTTASAAAPFGDDDFAVVWFRGTGTKVDLRHATVLDGVIGEASTVATGSFPLAYRPALALVDGFGAIAWTESLGSGRFAIRVALFRGP